MEKSPRTGKKKPNRVKRVVDKRSSEDVSRVPIIGLGASAGGIEALKEFFGAMPADSGMAFVIVQHLEPTHESRMAEILAKHTTMKVVQAGDGMPVQPNTVFTNPPGRALSIRDGRLVLGKPTERGHVEAAIDRFMTSLAEDLGAKAICIMLSGSSGSDGPRGVRAIRAAGGMCMAQKPGTAQFAAMPQAAIDTGLVDYVLPPGQMPAAMLEFAQYPQGLLTGHEKPPAEAVSSDLEAILKLLRAHTNSDYRHYRRTTVERRIRRRMGLRQIGRMSDYVKLLHKDLNELTQLAKDLLIGVSSFFRDADVFEELRNEAIVPLVEAKDDEASLRAWVPGCSTGEEAYSIAILLLEAKSAAGKSCPVQVFATDVDEQALETARAGVYPPSIVNDVSAERLERFFTKQGQTYQVDKHLRDAVVFSRHNILTDPPFSKLDLITCRNVLIYLEPIAQKKVLTVFGFALNVGGHLLLGKSEGVAGMEKVFEPISKKNRLYRLTHFNRQAAGELPPYFSGQPQGVVEREQAKPPEASNLVRANLVAQLEAAVKALRRDLLSNPEEYDSVNQELKAANEEIMSMNEELQSANEELEASKEEMQSLNEELSTVNSQLSDKVSELTALTNDLVNLLTATEIATVFLDGQLRIKRFTPRATEMLNLIESDLGRPVSHITQNFTGIDLAADTDKVLKKLSPLEKEVQAIDGRWYTVRILPYRTLDNRIDGAVVTFSDVSRLKETEGALWYEKKYLQNIVETVHCALMVLDDQLQVLSVNPAFYRIFQVQASDTVGQKLYDLGDLQWDIPQIRDVLQEVAEHGQKLENFEVQHKFPGIGWRVMLLNARRIESDNVTHRILLAIDDITDRKAAEAQLQKLADQLVRSNTDLEQFANVISHDLQEPLREIVGFLDLLPQQLGQNLNEKSQQYIFFVMEGAQRMQAMIKDLLDFGRLGREEAKRTTLDLAEPLNHTLRTMRVSIEQSGARVIHDPLPTVLGDSSQLARLFQNLVGNAIKFRGEEPLEIHIGASQSEEGWLISVRDNGIGIDMQFADRVFEVFQRLHARGQYEGTGIGLAICRRIVEQHGGRIWLESKAGKGTTFLFTLPAGGAPTSNSSDSAPTAGRVESGRPQNPRRSSS